MGFICINKKPKQSCTKIVSAIKRITGQKAGHLGTLDPLAEGVLPVAFGKSTRLFDYFLNKDKVYVASCKFGYETDTLDEDGIIVKTSSVIPTKQQIEKILPQFVGKFNQLPPVYSAKKVNGQRACDLARDGKIVELKPKEIEIFGIKLLSFDNGELEIELHCSAGTFVRSLFRDIAQKLGTFATTTHIKRTKSGCFDISQSVSIEDLTKDNWQDFVISNEEVIGCKKLLISNEQKERLLCGKNVFINEENLKNIDTIALMLDSKKLYGIASIENGKVCVKSFLLEEE